MQISGGGAGVRCGESGGGQIRGSVSGVGCGESGREQISGSVQESGVGNRGQISGSGAGVRCGESGGGQMSGIGVGVREWGRSQVWRVRCGKVGVSYLLVFNAQPTVTVISRR